MEARDPVIRASDVSKTIRGRRILEGVSLAIGPGEVVGLIGPNGAGKSTLIRILCGLSFPSEGAVSVGAGGDRSLGLAPEAPGFVEHLSGRRNLLLLAQVGGRASPGEVDEAIRRCGLDPADRRAVSKYSLGMRQRLGLAQALMERPRALILDEPTNGLDVLGITELRALIRSQAANGVAVLLASHLLTEVELACDRVLMIHRGRILRELETKDLHRIEGAVRLAVTTEADWEKVAGAFDAERSSGTGPPSGLVRTDLGVQGLLAALSEMDVSVEEIGPAAASLEDVFLSTVGVSL